MDQGPLRITVEVANAFIVDETNQPVKRRVRCDELLLAVHTVRKNWRVTLAVIEGALVVCGLILPRQRLEPGKEAQRQFPDIHHVFKGIIQRSSATFSGFIAELEFVVQRLVRNPAQNPQLPATLRAPFSITTQSVHETNLAAKLLLRTLDVLKEEAGFADDDDMMDDAMRSKLLALLKQPDVVHKAALQHALELQKVWKRCVRSPRQLTLELPSSIQVWLQNRAVCRLCCVCGLC